MLSSVAIFFILGNASYKNDGRQSTGGNSLQIRSNNKQLNSIQEREEANKVSVSSERLVNRDIKKSTSNRPMQKETNSKFANFVREHEKIYSSTKEYGMRKQIFDQSHAMLLRHNAISGNSWKMGINQFADRSTEELPLGLDKLALRSHHQSQRDTQTKVKENSRAPLPDYVDWREKGAATPVKNQGHCGSCWAFASTAALESHIAINTGTLLELSVQELVTCAPNPNNCGGTGGCDGNTAEQAFEFVSSGRGMVTEWEWGYISGKNHTVPACDLPSDDNNATIPGAIVSIDGYVSIEHNDYYGLLEAVATVGPIVVNVDASNWRLYKSGIFDERLYSNSTSRDINHVVVVYGYGSEVTTDPETGKENSQDYWLVRNSWGPLWGEDGYIRLKRDSNAATDDCKPDTTPEDGIACVGPDDSIVPPVVDVCGTSGVLYDALYPTGGHLLRESELIQQIQ